MRARDETREVGINKDWSYREQTASASFTKQLLTINAGNYDV